MADMHHFLPHSAADLESLAGNGLISLDASALLHPYRLSPASRNSWLSLIEQSSATDRLFVPHQSYLEYHRNRMAVVRQQHGTLAELHKALAPLLRDLDAAVDKQRGASERTGSVAWGDVKEAVATASSGIEKAAEDAKASLVDRHEARDATDEVHRRVSAAIDGRVGPEPTHVELDAAYSIGEARFKKEIPPGFHDSRKDKLRRRRNFGDVINWFQLMDRAREVDRSATFVTEDLKDDWWLLEGRQRVGALPTLRREFGDVVGHPFRLASVSGIMVNAANYGLDPIDDAAVSDAKSLDPDNQIVGDGDDRLQLLIRGLRDVADADANPDEQLRPFVLNLLGTLIEGEIDRN